MGDLAGNNPVVRAFNGSANGLLLSLALFIDRVKRLCYYVFQIKQLV
jgi:hypothetical protein